MAEANIQRALLARLEQIPGVYVQRVNVVVARDITGTRFTRSVDAGFADILLVVRGHAVAIEVKDDNGRQSPAQRAFQEEWEGAEGTYFLARGVAGIHAAVNLVREIAARGGP